MSGPDETFVRIGGIVYRVAVIALLALIATGGWDRFADRVQDALRPIMDVVHHRKEEGPTAEPMAPERPAAGGSGPLF